jgi:cobaltochelatase CobS
MENKKAIKEALLEMIFSGEIELELPDALVADGIRRCRADVREMLDHAMQNGGFPKDKVQGMMDERMGAYRTDLKKRMEQLVGEQTYTRMAVQAPDGTVIHTGIQHRQFKEVLDPLQAGLNVYMVGPAGSGKTTAAEQAAKALGVPFYFTGAITSEFKLTGFIDAHGRVVCPAFRQAYEKGGLFLFDEIDGSMAQAVLAFNAAIANNTMDFPDKAVTKHEKFYCVAAANTYGYGADRVYVGRNQLDGATIDRFVFIEWAYDEVLELKLSGNAEWTKKVQKARKAADSLKIRHVISPRASIAGGKMLALGVQEEFVERSVLWKGLDASSVGKIKATARI